MRIFGALILLAALAAPALARGAQVERAGQDDESLYKMPEGFFIGAGTSALQTEGAWNENGKAESQADHLFHIDKLGLAGSHDVSSDSYHRFKEDVAMAKAIGLQVYRLSLSWSRLLPTGKASEYNPDGLRFYKEFIQEIVDNDMEPFITLYHFDHPQSLQKEFLGWEDRKMIDYFVEYADFAFKSFGDKVKYWTTANEPNFYCLYFSSLMRVAGEATKEQLNANRCMQNFVLAHMRAYHVYKNKYFASQKGYVGTSAVIFHAKPATTTPEDIYAAEAFNNLHVGQVLHPVIFGDYPPVLKKVAKSNGRELIEYTDEERKLLTDSADFIGINVYNGNVASYTNKTETSGEQFGPGNILDDLLEDYKFIQLGGVGGDFAKIDSESMSRAVSWIWQQYGKPIVITENGYGDESAVGLHDHSRTVYFSAYIRSLLATVNTFGMEVWGYIAWSLIDCYEWNVGFSRTFGLVHVDFEGNTLKRTLKDSTKFFTQIIKDRYVPHIEETSGSPSLTATPAIVLVALIALWRTIRPL